MSNGWIIAVGASGGAGLEDICALLSELPPSLNAVVLIVLHRPWDQPSQLLEVLSKRSQIPVVIAPQGDRLKPGIASSRSQTRWVPVTRAWPAGWLASQFLGIQQPQARLQFSAACVGVLHAFRGLRAKP